MQEGSCGFKFSSPPSFLYHRFHADVSFFLECFKVHSRCMTVFKKKSLLDHSTAAGTNQKRNCKRLLVHNKTKVIRNVVQAVVSIVMLSDLCLKS